MIPARKLWTDGAAGRSRAYWETADLFDAPSWSGWEPPTTDAGSPANWATADADDPLLYLNGSVFTNYLPNLYCLDVIACELTRSTLLRPAFSLQEAEAACVRSRVVACGTLLDPELQARGAGALPRPFSEPRV